MNERKRRAITWDTIERMAFHPDNTNKWLGVFEKTLEPLWGIQPGDALCQWKVSFSVPVLGLTCKYAVESEAKYGATFESGEQPESTFWMVHADSDYISKGALHRAPDPYPAEDKANHLRHDVTAILDGKVFHPRCHTHYESLGHLGQEMENVCTLGLHEIRVGGGIENAYVFLFHLRYQFCLVAEQVRIDERNRLINLFTDAINTNQQSVSANDLFNYQHQVQ